MTVLQTCIVRNKIEINFIATLDRDTFNIYPSPVCQVLNVNWSAFVKAIFPTLQSHGWNNGTHGGCQLDSGDLALLPLTMGPLLCHWPLCGRHGCSWRVLPPPSTPTHPSPSHPTLRPSHPPPHPSHLPPLLSILTAERDGKKYHQI